VINPSSCLMSPWAVNRWSARFTFSRLAETIEASVRCDSRTSIRIPVWLTQVEELSGD
jgi:hypothetical protein